MVSFLTALIDNHNYSLDVGSMANPITSVNGPVARSTKQPKNPENTTTVTFATQVNQTNLKSSARRQDFSGVWA
ncbi:unnamed protein product [Didymodactylos carnosus]|uniref:Uncharacterized protein n=1 Tax=Didymodactylos carnosus TaxID=1234261 RepID=A0A8S2HWS8_9BILA|nr:unnamed protein product [Didymodactylos carnosus]CAF3694099.1 unnamed protein product [Didymodactylos carnosus]